MSDSHRMETRQRSRSKTPFIQGRSAIDHEITDMAIESSIFKKKAPNVQTIIEESYKETYGPAAAKKQSSTLVTSKTTITSNQVITTKSSEMASTRAATSTPKQSKYLHESFAAQFGSGGADAAGRRISETSQNESNAELERTQQQQTLSSSWNSSGKKDNLLRRLFSNSWGATTGNKLPVDQEHLAYMDYKMAGEYWRTTPKTDYTYSYLSKQRRELAPGVIAMPNMSRRSLDQHSNRVTRMLQSNPSAADSIRRRYLSKNQQNTEHSLYYESGDELDALSNVDQLSKKSFYLTTTGTANGRRRESNTYEQQSWLERILTSIVTIFTTIIYGKETSLDDSALHRQQTNVVERGFFGSIWHGISSAVLGVFRRIYLFISNVLYWDTWLLQRENPNRKWKKRFLLLLLLLFPLLLLAGVFYYLHPDETFPPRYVSEYQFSLSTALPKLDMSAYINQEQVDNFKEQTYARLLDLRDWTDDYLLYLKTVARNVGSGTRKFFQREEHFDRI